MQIKGWIVFFIAASISGQAYSGPGMSKCLGCSPAERPSRQATAGSARPSSGAISRSGVASSAPRPITASSRTPSAPSAGTTLSRPVSGASSTGLAGLGPVDDLREASYQPGPATPRRVRPAPSPRQAWGAEEEALSRSPSLPNIVSFAGPVREPGAGEGAAAIAHKLGVVRMDDVEPFSIDRSSDVGQERVVPGVGRRKSVGTELVVPDSSTIASIAPMTFSPKTPAQIAARKLAKKAIMETATKRVDEITDQEIKKIDTYIQVEMARVVDPEWMYEQQVKTNAYKKFIDQRLTEEETASLEKLLTDRKKALRIRP